MRSQGDSFVTLAEYDKVARPAPRRRVAAKEVLVLVMASQSLQERVSLLEHTW